ncbi:hypothetical protein DFP72DRAFT_816916 [Ephemerocybe angulata]|uniref:Plus3 domain-containing protein n=1 Tax=Ephemerocybe angulata TaxID=980116 RepID=A0A8H6M4H0_9AGAR|nr:hypothetical protein DFP72DRAFT_816916 [Tulosesus angulatus]
MSDFDDDIDDQLLALAGESGVKERRKSKGSKSRSSKKRKVENSDSERDVESEEDDDMEDESNDPYPYEGQYLDATDKETLLGLPEIKREEILAERSEEKRRLQEKRVLAQMVKAQKGAGLKMELDEESVARAAKRQHTARGATKEKSRKLDELKARRKAQDESRKRAKLSPKSHRDRSASPQDMDISDDEEEDGIITREEQQEDRERRLLGISTSNSREEEVDDTSPAELADFNQCRLTRDLVAKHCLAPWFEEYATGTWVRYLIGNEGNEPVYRICEIQSLSPNRVKPYKVNDRLIDQAVELKHGKSMKSFNMDRISNSQFTRREYERLMTVCKEEKVSFPTKGELKKKYEQMRKLQARPLTESDIDNMLKRRKEMQSTTNPSTLKMERQRLNQARSLAQKRHDYTEVAELEQKISELQAQIDASGIDHVVGDSRDEALRKVNERNRKANVEAVRKAELAESERKRREREMMAKAAREGGTAAGVAIAIKHDPSARLKTVPRMFNPSTPTTRPGTPATASQSKAGTPGANDATNGNKPPVANRTSVVNSQIAFEQKLLDTIDIDLGDF